MQSFEERKEKEREEDRTKKAPAPPPHICVVNIDIYIYRNFFSGQKEHARLLLISSSIPWGVFAFSSRFFVLSTNV